MHRQVGYLRLRAGGERQHREFTGHACRYLSTFEDFCMTSVQSRREWQHDVVSEVEISILYRHWLTQHEGNYENHQRQHRLHPIRLKLSALLVSTIQTMRCLVLKSNSYIDAGAGLGAWTAVFRWRNWRLTSSATSSNSVQAQIAFKIISSILCDWRKSRSWSSN